MNCVHHWMVEDAAGAEAPAQCKKCDVTKVFSNTPADNGWIATDNTIVMDRRTK